MVETESWAIRAMMRLPETPPLSLPRPLLTEASAFPRASPELLAVVPRVPVGDRRKPYAVCLHCSAPHLSTQVTSIQVLPNRHLPPSCLSIPQNEVENLVPGPTWLRD